MNLVDKLLEVINLLLDDADAATPKVRILEGASQVLVHDLLSSHATSVPQQGHVRIVEVLPFCLLLGIDTESKHVPEGVRKVVEGEARDVKVKLRRPKHVINLGEGVTVPLGPRLAHLLLEKARREGLASLPRLVHCAVKIVPCGDVAEESDRALRVVPAVLKPLSVCLAEVNQGVAHNSLEEDAGSLGEVHGVAGLGALHVSHHPVVVSMPQLVGEGADVLEGTRVGAHVDSRVAALGKLCAVRPGAPLLARTTVDPPLSLHLVDKGAHVRVDTAHGV
mmetsp:Transcript_21227/g.49205  ORF Transcript_21227/g.49205 Transcript_21227/m.49205 type:complete len:279 (-) Transcript_21227:1226-2062(-)